MKKKGKFYRAYTIEKSLKHHVIEWAAMAMSVIGAVMNAQPTSGDSMCLCWEIFYGLASL